MRFDICLVIIITAINLMAFLPKVTILSLFRRNFYSFHYGNKRKFGKLSEPHYNKPFSSPNKTLQRIK